MKILALRFPFVMVVFGFLLFTASTCDKISLDNPEITSSELQNHVEILASDELGGRLPGSSGDSMAAEYIRKHLESYGMDLPYERGIQYFTVTSKVQAGKDNHLSIGGWPAEYGKDFSSYPFSGTAKHSSEVVFAGYGLKLKNDTLVHDDFSDVSLEGKWVLLFRGEPSGNILSGISDRDKAMQVADLGAKGLLFVSPVSYDTKDELVQPSRTEGAMAIPVVHIHRATADRIFASVNTSVSEMENVLKDLRKTKSTLLPILIEGQTDIVTSVLKTRNIAGIIPGSDPSLKKEYIVIGAHYDHLGMGGPGSSSRKPDTLAVHNGADDNASGVATLIELAEYYAEHRQKLKRSLIFAAFGAEEMGILGSKYFMDHLPIGEGKITAMVNLDMVGRLKDDSSLQIGGTGSSEEGVQLLNKANEDSFFRMIMSPEGIGPSDHASFYRQNIPVFFLSTGAHMDYHTPEDDPSAINFAGMEKVANFSSRLVYMIDTLPQSLTFKEAGPKDQPQGRPRFKVTLGIMPDFASTGNEGLRVDFVTKDKPAYKGGMLKGDIIKAINEKPVTNIQDYMYRLSKLNAGETITVEVERNGKRELLIIQL